MNELTNRIFFTGVYTAACIIFTFCLVRLGVSFTTAFWLGPVIGFIVYSGALAIIGEITDE